MKKNKIFYLFLIILFLLSLVTIFFYKNSTKEIVEIKKEKDEKIKWITYKNEEYGFELKYPGEWANNKGAFTSITQEDDGFTPSILRDFPQCQKDEIRLLENAKRYQHLSSPKTIDVKSLSENARLVSCSISLRVEKNPNQLSIKDFLKEKFLDLPLDNSSITNIDTVDMLQIQKNNNTETSLSNNLFYYLRGFGEKEGIEEETTPSFIRGREQFIVSKDDIVVFINNNINKEDLLLSENKDIFRQVTESLEFIKSSQ